MRARRVLQLFVVLVVGGLTGGSWSAADGPPSAPWRAAAQRLEQSFPGVGLLERKGRISRVYGRAFSSGASPEEAAERFLQEHVGLFGVTSNELQPGSLSDAGARTRPVIYQPQSGSYKFTLVSYRQQRDGIPVHRSDLRLLVRNEPGHPLVWAGSALRDLGSFEVSAVQLERIRRPEFVQQRFEAGKRAVLDVFPELENFSAPKVVIWAGVDEMEVEPRVAVSFVADNFGPGLPANHKWLYLTDLETGTILYQEERVVREISGNVSGMATEGAGAEHCEIEVATPMPYVEVTDGTNAVFADANGDFVIPGSGLRADAAPEGLYFDVRNFLGPLEMVSAMAPFQLVLNADNSDELVRAQVNGYIEANRVRDFVARFNPAYPTFTDTDIPVWVNRTDGFCPGNAWYDPGDSSSPTFYSINFCQSSSNRPNTAYSSVVYHEFGHHVVSAGGSGQGQYGEGMGDVMSVLMLDEPRLAIGFLGDCDGALRGAQNTLQYPCSGGIHYCGQLLSGAVWSTRNKLVVDHPTDYLDILSNLAINAVLLHDGSLITPAITVDYLTLDDDDGNLLNGTPHFDEINGGFSAHRMPGPAKLTGLQIGPQGGLVSTGTVGDNIVYTLENRDLTPLDFSVTALESWITVTGGSGSLAPGATAPVEVSLNSEIEQLGAGVHRGNVFFVNETNHDGDQTRGVLLVGGGALYSSTEVPRFISWVAPASSTLAIDDDFCVGDVNVTVDITHGDVSELIVELQSPAGTSVRLHSPGSLPGTSLVKTYDEQAGVLPAGPGSLSDFNGESPLGSWTLSITDTFLPNTGDLNGWSLEMLRCPPTANSIDVTVVKTLPTAIVLDAQSTVGNPLNHVVYSLPDQGRLIDPNGGTIASVPYTLLAGGDTVIFDPDNVFAGRDGFAYKGNDGQDSNLAEVDIQIGDRILIEAFPLDSDPGWSTTGAWAFGQPTGQGSRSGDPISGYTGVNVYGYKLTGDYGSNLGELPLTSGAIDCSGFQDVEVSFRRWLGVELAAFDQARFEASNDGTSWTTIWEHSGGTIDESDWSLQTYDISAVADNEASVFLRWVMGSTDGSETYPGWNIDDVELTGLTPVSRVDLVLSKTELSWAPLADAISYDVVQGDLATLRGSEGDFGVATEACLGNDLAATNLPGPPDPDAGEAQWFLVRGVALPGSMSYGSFGEGQLDERDAEIDSAIAACP